MKSLHKAYVKEYYFDKVLGEEVIVAENKFANEKVVVPKSLILGRRGPKDLVGKIVDYVETGRTTECINKDGLKEKRKIVSMLDAMDIKRNIILKQFRDGEVLSGRVISVTDWGAFISIDGVSCVLRNCDFSNDYTIVADVYKEGDIIDGLIYRKTTERDRIGVQKIEKYQNPVQIDVSTLKREDIVTGRIRNVKIFGCFVGIASNVDVLCEIPPNYEISEGLTVRCVLKTVDPSKGKLRGEIVEIVDRQRLIEDRQRLAEALYTE